MLDTFSNQHRTKREAESMPKDTKRRSYVSPRQTINETRKGGGEEVEKGEMVELNTARVSHAILLLA